VADVDVELDVVVEADVVLVLLVDEVVVLVAEVAVLVGVVVVELPEAAAWNWACETVRGVLLPAQLVTSSWYVVVTSPGDDLPMHWAALSTKLPPLPHRHVFIALTLSPLQLLAVAALLRHNCAPVG